MAIKLKKCPFCDPQADDAQLVIKHVQWGSDVGTKQRMFVECKGCGAHGPCTPFDTADFGRGVEYVIDAWNERKAR